jgi:protein-tyrosine phosphatase
MCRMAEWDGIKVIAATPHYFEGADSSEPNMIHALVDSLNGQLRAEGINLKVVVGMEVRVTNDLADLVVQRKVLSLNEGRYLLVEFAPTQVPVGVENLVKQLRTVNRALILAHVEKNLSIQRNPEYLANLLSLVEPWDVLVQITADSLLGQSGGNAAATARFLLKHNLAHVIASDAHSVRARPPLLSCARKVAAKLIGEEKSRQLVWDIPKAVLTGIDFPRYDGPRSFKKWWNLFSR